MLYIDLPISSFIPLDVDNFGQFGILLFFNVLSLKKTPKNYMFVYRCKEDKQHAFFLSFTIFFMICDWDSRVSSVVVFFLFS